MRRSASRLITLAWVASTRRWRVSVIVVAHSIRSNNTPNGVQRSIVMPGFITDGFVADPGLVLNNKGSKSLLMAMVLLTQKA